MLEEGSSKKDDWELSNCGVIGNTCISGGISFVRCDLWVDDIECLGKVLIDRLAKKSSSMDCVLGNVSPCTS